MKQLMQNDGYARSVRRQSRGGWITPSACHLQPAAGGRKRRSNPFRWSVIVPASDKLARGAKTRSTPWLRQHRVRLP